LGFFCALIWRIVGQPIYRNSLIIQLHCCAAAPLPSRGGVPEGRGGVCNQLSANKIQTPPLPLPLKGGEWLPPCSTGLSD